MVNSTKIGKMREHMMENNEGNKARNESDSMAVSYQIGDPMILPFLAKEQNNMCEPMSIGLSNRIEMISFFSNNHIYW